MSKARNRFRPLPLAALAAVAALAAAGGGCDAEPGSDCSDDVDCPSGAGICRAGRCEVLVCEGRGDCPSGTCGLDGYCRPVECDPVRACAGGFACTEGLCQSPAAIGREVGVVEWDFITPPSPLPPDAFRADARPDGPTPDVAPPLVDAAPPEPDAPPPPDATPPDAAPEPDARALLAAFLTLTFTFERGDCAAREPASPKDLWVEELADGSLFGRLSAPGGGSGVDLEGQREGDAVHLTATSPLPVAGACTPQLGVSLEGTLTSGGAVGMTGLADWHTATTVAECEAPIDCHRFDRFESAGR